MTLLESRNLLYITPSVLCRERLQMRAAMGEKMAMPSFISCLKTQCNVEKNGPQGTELSRTCQQFLHHRHLPLFCSAP